MTRINCGEVRELLTAYLDDELPLAERRSVAEHMANCVDCAANFETQLALRKRIVAAGTFGLPAGLEAKVRTQLGVADREASVARRRLRLGLSHAAAAAVGAVVLYGSMMHTGSTGSIVRDAMTAHARAQMSGETVQVASSDQHTVRPWISSRVPFSPPVFDLKPSEFPLLGGRVDVLGERPAAVAVYSRRKHRIDVFAQPADATSIPHLLVTSRNGYSLQSWRSGDFAYLAISDISAAELQTFVDLVNVAAK